MDRTANGGCGAAAARLLPFLRAAAAAAPAAAADDDDDGGAAASEWAQVAALLAHSLAQRASADARTDTLVPLEGGEEDTE